MRTRSLLLVSVGGVALYLGCGGDDAASSPTNDAGTEDASTPSGPLDSGTDDAGFDAGPPVAPYDWVGVIGTGQSLSIGATAGVISTTASFHNGKLVDSGPDPKYPVDGTGAMYAVVPLVEKIRGAVTGYNDSQYPNNIAGETPHSGMASELTYLFAAHGGGDYVSMHTVVGWSGNPLVNINKEGTGRAYPGSLQEVRAFTALAKAANKTYGVGGIILTHGETDAANPAYGAGLKTFIADYNTDIKAITGQTRDIPVFISQQSVNDGPTSSAVQVWQDGLVEPRIVCVGPKYQYQYSPDNLHFQAPGYMRLGEKYAEVFDIVVNQGKTWAPVQPKNIATTGNKIVIVFNVPSPPLAWDETLAPPHQSSHAAWMKGRGFEVVSGNTELAITSADLTAADTVTLTMAAAVTGSVTVQYATTQDGGGNQGGLVTGFRGQLADSDGLIGYDEESLALTLTQGSASATFTSGAFAQRAVRDIVTVAGAPVNWTVLDAANGTLTMSAPWPGATGVTPVKIHHDLRNYAVHFSQATP